MPYRKSPTAPTRAETAPGSSVGTERHPHANPLPRPSRRHRTRNPTDPSGPANPTGDVAVKDAVPNALLLGSHDQTFNVVALRDRRKRVDDSAQHVLAQLGRQRLVVAARQLKVVLVGVGGFAGDHTQDENRSRNRRCVLGPAVDRQRRPTRNITAARELALRNGGEASVFLLGREHLVLPL